MNNTLKLLLAGLSGGALSYALMTLTAAPSHTADAEADSNQPLYWVAPMDSNYRRDKPGKSPMGMDLVPVYAESEEQVPGAVTISPEVVNNLGVRTAAVEVGPMHSTISTVGYVQYDEDKLVHIHPRVDGWVETLYIKAAGEPVEQGQPLYSLYSPQLVNAQEEFLIALNRNNAALIKAARERLMALQLSTDFIASLETQRQVRQTITFYARQSGVIAELKIREGFYVNPGNTLMSVAQLDQVWVEAEVFERDTALVKAGQPVTMTLDYLPGVRWQGNVDYVYPTLNETTRTLRVRLKFDNAAGQLKPNMFAQVQIQAGSKAQAMQVPSEAVIRTGKQDRVVMALGEGRFKSVAVTLGRVGLQSTEILEGLQQDDRVVTSAHFLIDSESSKSSDFKRMSADAKPTQVWMAGTVNHYEAQSDVINMTHDAVPEWEWPEMTMDFQLADTLDSSALKTGQSLHFEVTKTDAGYEITTIHIMAEPTLPRATVDGHIKAIDAASRIATIHRGAIEKWGRAAATMDFVIAEDIDLSAFNVGDQITFTFEVGDDFVVTQMQHSEQDSAMSEHAHH
ncbi:MULTISPECIES: efflux RND transporter periplasmic adaptor subunit [unclassified Pseudoalteromonas]|uniref:efflux RND transporter periplasmic adaptor subunit n=1 Tax=unclassified Pseudoalteromonas TaxID=194690 RepID=UPI0020970E23|nr:efflux RND transporter periplasmic adaptor subunit [Pseudoalteromonas sp. XMcav2-N]MCO7188140.1 efflux RND transporter periplasmic adaptor subunit [Pseudoalteromonas sp. XMcav2-N]